MFKFRRKKSRVRRVRDRIGRSVKNARKKAGRKSMMFVGKSVIKTMRVMNAVSSRMAARRAARHEREFKAQIIAEYEKSRTKYSNGVAVLDV